MLNRKKILIGFISIIIFSGFIRKDTDIYFEMNKSIDIFGRVYKEVALNYVDPLNPEEFMLAGIAGMLGSLDPYTNFIDDTQQKDIDIITKGKYGGIGATVGLRNDLITIVDLIEGYSAQRQGLMIGDVITHVNDIPVGQDNYEELGDHLKGDAGTIVKITIRREGTVEALIFNLVREDIEIKNLSYYGFYPEKSSNVYLKLSGFSRSAGEEVKAALLELKEQKNIESIILDLRGNPGGLLDAAIDVCEKFLNKGELVVSVKGRDSLSVKNYFSLQEPIAGNIKMAVLIDEGSASASEIVAGAVQDHDRAVIVGTNSFGKGLVQTIVPLSYNTSLKLTTAKYYTPSGRSIQRIDYSNKNKVFESSKTNNQDEYSTDNKRKVLSAGGITPDSTVTYRSRSALIQRLIADGMFFRFATNLYNNNPSNNFSTIKDNLLFQEFNNYLRAQNFEYKSQSERIIDQLKISLKEEGIDKDYIEQLEKIKSSLGIHHSEELDKYSKDVIGSIREELAARSNGRTARILESLRYDNQLETALTIVNDSKQYNRFLKKNAD